MKQRTILLTIDTIAELFKDYLDPQDLPSDARPVTILFKPSEAGKLALVMESSSWSEGLAPLQVHFDIRRIYGVG